MPLHDRAQGRADALVGYFRAGHEIVREHVAGDADNLAVGPVLADIVSTSTILIGGAGLVAGDVQHPRL